MANQQLKSYSEILNEDPEIVTRLAGPTPTPTPYTPDVTVTRGTSPAPAVAAQQSYEGLASTHQQLADNSVEAGKVAFDEGQSKASELGDVAAHDQAQVDDVRREYAKNDKLRTEYRQKLLDLTDKQLEPVIHEEPWQKAVSAIGKMAGVAAQVWLGPLGGVVAAGMNAIDDAVHSNVRQQLDEKNQAARNTPLLRDLLDDIDHDDVDVADRSAKLLALNYTAASRRLEKLAAQATSYQDKLKYNRLALESTAKAEAIDVDRNDKEAEAQRVAAARMAKARASALNQKPDWSRMPIGALQAMAQSPDAPAGLVEYVAALDKKRSDAKGDGKGEIPPPPVGRDVTNPQVWSSVSPPERTKFRSAQAALESYNRDSNKLQALVREHGTESFSLTGDASSEMAALQANMLAAVKDIKELGTLDNGLIELTGRLHGDATGFWSLGSSVLSKLKATQASMNAGVEAKARELGLSHKAVEEDPVVKPRVPPPRAPAGNEANLQMLRDNAQAARRAQREKYSDIVSRYNP